MRAGRSCVPSAGYLFCFSNRYSFIYFKKKMTRTRNARAEPGCVDICKYKLRMKCTNEHKSQIWLQRQIVLQLFPWKSSCQIELVKQNFTVVNGAQLYYPFFLLPASYRLNSTIALVFGHQLCRQLSSSDVLFPSPPELPPPGPQSTALYRRWWVIPSDSPQTAMPNKKNPNFRFKGLG